MTQRLDILDRLHQRLLEIIGTALPLIASSVHDADLAGLAHLREEMVAAIEAYAQHVHHHVFEAAVASGDPVRIAAANDLKIGCISLTQAYRAFGERWRHRDGIANWPEYRLSAIVMMKQVRNHVRVASRWDEDAPTRALQPV